MMTIKFTALCIDLFSILDIRSVKTIMWNISFKFHVNIGRIMSFMFHVNIGSHKNQAKVPVITVNTIGRQHFHKSHMENEVLKSLCIPKCYFGA